MKEKNEKYMTTGQMARFLHLNEKKIYRLASEGKIPSVRISGKWLFPVDLVERYLEERTTYPAEGLMDRLLPSLFVIEGSDDLLFKEIIFSAARSSGYPVAFGVLGSEGGIGLLASRRVHGATVHFVVEEASRELPKLRDDFCLVSLFRRQQGFIVKGDGPGSCAEIVEKKMKLAVREKSCGTYHLARSLFAKEKKDLDSYAEKTGPHLTHLEAAQSVASGEAHAAVGIRRAADLMSLKFLPLCEEEFYLMVPSKIVGERIFMTLLDAFFEALKLAPESSKSGYSFGSTGRIRPLKPS
jgi:putative molybdopterin biosynthesis protein